MRWHPFALKFPAMTGDEWANFLAGIKLTKGVHDQPVLYRMIKVNGRKEREYIDGRQRYTACKTLKLPCKVKRVRVKDKDLIDFIIAHQFNRRQFNWDQRAKLIGDLRSMGQSTRKIAATLHVDPKTVRNSLGATGDNSPPRITGVDGKTYAASRPPTVADRPSPRKMLSAYQVGLNEMNAFAIGHGLEDHDDELLEIRGIHAELVIRLERWSKALA